MEGWIKLHRKLLDNPIFKNHKTLQTFMYCLLKATHTEHEQMVGDSIVHLMPGQLATGRKAISKGTGLTEQNVRTALIKLEKLNILTIKKGNKFSIISMVNWNTNQQPNQQVTSSQPAANQQVTTNNNVKNENKVEEIEDHASSEKKLDRFDFEETRNVWNEICKSSKTVCSKKMVTCEKMKKNLNACYKKYSSSCKARGKKATSRNDWCSGYFRAVHDWAEPWAGKREGDNFKLNLEYASRIDTYDKVVEWVAND